MGIVNATPDSFSDGGQFFRPEDACARCDTLVAEGVDILDIGGESTRPGSVAPDWREELARVLPVVRHAVGLGVPVSVDTSQAEVMTEVLAAGPTSSTTSVRWIDRVRWMWSGKRRRPGSASCTARASRPPCNRHPTMPM
jgi:dihydropteroate synthase